MLSGVRVVRSAQELTGEPTGAEGEKRRAYGFRSVLTDAACPGLRAVRLEKWGTVMYLLSNEGTENIRTEVTVAERGGLLLADLWTGKAYRAASRQTENGTAFPLALRSCQVLLGRSGAGRSMRCGCRAGGNGRRFRNDRTGKNGSGGNGAVSGAAPAGAGGLDRPLCPDGEVGEPGRI